VGQCAAPAHCESEGRVEDMRGSRLLPGAAACGLLFLHASLFADTKKEAIALRPQDIRWFTPAYYTDGRQRAHLHGDSAKGGDWIDRVRIPGGSRVLAHVHTEDEIVTVLEGSWYLGMGEKFDQAKLSAYAAGRFIYIPAGVPHFLATPEGPSIVQVSGHGIFHTNYLER
jgi:quercetin dioxygenase-like cupin family protein